jgi:hypothetical protein
MPLPIGDATATPGSPISGPDDASPLAPEQTPNYQTMVSNSDLTTTTTTVEDDDTVDDLQSYAGSGVGRGVPTYIEWTGGGNRVYVTGTFVNWEAKFRLQRRFVASFGPSPCSLLLIRSIVKITPLSCLQS